MRKSDSASFAGECDMKQVMIRLVILFIGTIILSSCIVPVGEEGRGRYYEESRDREHHEERCHERRGERWDHDEHRHEHRRHHEENGY